MTLDILNSPLSEDGAKGYGAMLAEGTYKNCTITELTEVDMSEDAAASGVRARVCVVFNTPDYNEPIRGYINIKNAAAPHPKSAMFSLVTAIWPEESDRVGKSPLDWVGKTVDILCVHDTNQGGKPYPKLNYRPCK
jgi:hypothetical protein